MLEIAQDVVEQVGVAALWIVSVGAWAFLIYGIFFAWRDRAKP